MSGEDRPERGGSGAERPDRPRLPDDFVRLADLLPETPGRLPGAAGGHHPLRAADAQARIAALWAAVVGEEVARQSQPLSLKSGRLVVATSSAVWAQTLQLMAEQIRGPLNRELGGEIVTELRFRPAGYDPGGGAGAPRGLRGPSPWPGAAWAEREDPSGDPEANVAAGPGPDEPRPRRRLSPEEEREIEAVRRLAPTDELGERIGRAMRAAWERSPRVGRRP